MPEYLRVPMLTLALCTHISHHHALAQLKQRKQPDADAELKKAFTALSGGKDTIPAKSLVHVLKTIGEPIPEDRLEMLLKAQGVSPGSSVTEAQFVELLKS